MLGIEKVTERIKPGPGVVGLIITALIVGMVALGTVASTMDGDWFKIAVVIIIVVLFAAVVVSCIWYSIRYPHTALMDREHILAYLIHPAAAKDQTLVKDITPGPNSNPPAQLLQSSEAPQITSDGGEDE